MGPQNPRLRADPAGGGVCISDPAKSLIRRDIASSLNVGISVSMKKPAIGSLDIPTREMSVAAMAALKSS
jgi:hypothetical protein